MGSKKPPLDEPPKRGRTEVLVTYKATPVLKFSKFLVIYSELEDKPLSKLPLFLVAEKLEGIVGKNYKAKKLPSGDILIEVDRKV